MNMEMAYVAFTCIMSYIHDPKDRCVVSEVCRTLYELEGLTRKHVTISFCYSTTPQRLRQRFPNLQSLKVKGRPKSDRFELILKDWGGFATPWVREIAHSFHCLRSLHFCGMTVVDSDLELLAHARRHALESLKLHKCSGFSTDGLFHIGRSCRKLKTLFLEESSIVEKGGKWVHALATNNTVLETLNFQHTQLFLVLQLTSLKCLWFIGHTDFISGRDLLAMASPFWNIEFNSKFVDDYDSHLLAYYSLAGPRTDRPITIVSLDSSFSLLRDLPPIS